MPYNPNKTITANSKGIIISFRDDNKPKYIPYKNKEVDNLQHLGRSLYQTFDLPAFNKIQQKLYAEALYGINAYDQSEIMTLTHKDILRITALHRRVQFFLNRWKQEIMDCKVDALLSKLFPHSKVVKDMSTVKGYNRAFTARYSFKELGLTQEAVANKLVEMGFLPQNFFQLT
jgi:hypothetical protein